MTSYTVPAGTIYVTTTGSGGGGGASYATTNAAGYASQNAALTGGGFAHASTVFVNNNTINTNTFNIANTLISHVENGRIVLTVKGENPVLRTERGDIELNTLFEMVERAEAILCLIEADMKRLDKYPALEQAYENYKVIDALCRDDDE